MDVSIKDYFDSQFFNPQESELTRVKLGRWMGYVVGFIATAFAIPFGYEFGIKELSWGNETIGIVIAIAGMISLGSLIALVTSKTWQAVLTPVGQGEKRLLRKKGYCENFSYLPNILVGVFSAAAPAVATDSHYRNISQELAMTLDVVTLVGFTTLRSWSIRRLLSEMTIGIHNLYIERYGSFDKRFRLTQALKVSLKLIKNNSETKNKDFFNQLISADIGIETKINYIFNLRTNDLFEDVKVTEEPWPRFIIRNLGALIALFYPYPSYELSKQASDMVWNGVGAQNPLFREISREIFGVSSYACTAALGVITTSATFSKAYDMLMRVFGCSDTVRTDQCGSSRRQTISHVLSVMFIFVAFTSSAPRTEVSITYTSQKFPAYYNLVVICTAISTFANDYWAIVGLKNEWMHGSSEKQKLLGMLGVLLTKLSSFNNDVIDNLYEFIFEKGCKEDDKSSSVLSINTSNKDLSRKAVCCHNIFSSKTQRIPYFHEKISKNYKLLDERDALLSRSGMCAIL